jgi:hypothetical protein
LASSADIYVSNRVKEKERVTNQQRSLFCKLTQSRCVWFAYIIEKLSDVKLFQREYLRPFLLADMIIENDTTGTMVLDFSQEMMSA